MFILPVHWLASSVVAHVQDDDNDDQWQRHLDDKHMVAVWSHKLPCYTVHFITPNESSLHRPPPPLYDNWHTWQNPPSIASLERPTNEIQSSPTPPAFSYRQFGKHVFVSLNYGINWTRFPDKTTTTAAVEDAKSKGEESKRRKGRNWINFATNGTELIGNY